jgi:hypothetical protein
VLRSFVNIERQIRIASSSSSNRSLTGGQAYPYARDSVSFHAAPMPSIALPDETTSSVVTTLARNAGLRYVTPVTIVPRRICDVLAATPPSSV